MPDTSSVGDTSISTPNSVLDALRAALNADKSKWDEYAARSGVNLWTIRNIASGKSGNPELDNVQPLLDLFGLVVVPADQLEGVSAAR